MRDIKTIHSRSNHLILTTKRQSVGVIPELHFEGHAIACVDSKLLFGLFENEDVTVPVF